LKLHPLLLLLGACFAATMARADVAPPDSILRFEPAPGLADSALGERSRVPAHLHVNDESEWLRAPVGDALLVPPEQWRERHAPRKQYGDLLLDYNRVDLVRYGLTYQVQDPPSMHPRLGTRIEYSTGRRRVLYGVQLEQPLLPTARFVLGLGATRRSEHPDLQQVDDAENSLALLVSHEDWRDYFEREGIGAYLSWRVPDFSTVSAHVRSDTYRSLVMSPHVHSWFHTDRPLRANPAIDEGEAHRVLVRLERLAHKTRHSRGGFYHWIEWQRAGGGLGGDFDYARVLADLRSVVRLSPGTTLSLRAVGGTALSGTLPRQEEFVIGGVDGLRAHPIGAYRGDRIVLGQAEYSVGLPPVRNAGMDEGLQVLAFLDAGRAWIGEHRDDLVDQHYAADAGIGLATADDDLRVTVARDLHRANSDLVVSLRLQRPF
jgi:hypothetical protein